MPSPGDFQQLGLPAISRRCAQESIRFFDRQDHDPRYCFELFRRAILDRNQQAWSRLCVQYQPLVASWVERHPAFAVSGEETGYFVNGALLKMWTTLSPAKFADFPNLKSVLRYLQMCVNSVIIDYTRRREHAGLELRVALKEADDKPGKSDVEGQVLDQVYRQELWQSLSERLRNEKERRAVYGTFILALKPREIQAQYPGVFRTVDEVYRAKDNVIARLRRDDKFKDLLEPIRDVGKQA